MEKDSLFDEVEFAFSCNKDKGDFGHPLEQLLSIIASERMCGSYESYAPTNGTKVRDEK